MGILHLTLVEEGSKMKFIAAACLVAAAFAEPEAKADADAAVLYGAYGYGGHTSPYALGYRGYAGYAGYAGAYGAYPYSEYMVAVTLARGLLMLSPRLMLMPTM